MKRIYLAGPEVFLPEPGRAATYFKAVLAEHGLEGVFPLDGEVPACRTPAETAAAIYRANVALIDGCHGVLASMAPFRGASMDVGTSWEMGYAHGRGLPVVGYMNDPATMPDAHGKAVWSTPAHDPRNGEQLTYRERANAWNYSEAKVHERCFADRGAFSGEQTLTERGGRWFDRKGWSVEDFGLPDNLMVICCAGGRIEPNFELAAARMAVLLAEQLAAE